MTAPWIEARGLHTFYGASHVLQAYGTKPILAKGGLQAILDSGRTEIKLVTVDCSDVDLNLMREHPEIFLACVALLPSQAL